MKTPRFLISLLLLASLGAGCAVAPTPTADTPTSPTVVSGWQDVGDGVMRYETMYGTRATKGVLRLYRFPNVGWNWEFAQSTSTASVREWMDRLPGANVVINGVYFHEDNLPSGAFVSHGQRIGTRSFDADKSALIVLSPGPKIVDLMEQPNALDSAVEAAQTFPYLIKAGTPAVAEDSGKLAERSFVGTDVNGYFYVGVAINESLSLYELAGVLAAQPIAWKDVANLDGGPSTGLIADFQKENRGRTSLTPVSNVIVGRFIPSPSSTSPSP